jgi:hypothetical protein
MVEKRGTGKSLGSVDHAGREGWAGEIEGACSTVPSITLSGTPGDTSVSLTMTWSKAKPGDKRKGYTDHACKGVSYGRDMSSIMLYRFREHERSSTQDCQEKVGRYAYTGMHRRPRSKRLPPFTQVTEHSEILAICTGG